jgi:hypothetical protein
MLAEYGFLLLLFAFLAMPLVAEVLRNRLKGREGKPPSRNRAGDDLVK